MARPPNLTDAQVTMAARTAFVRDLAVGRIDDRPEART
jgi:hypothetical protein